MSVRGEIKEQLVEGLEGADFPIDNPEDLLDAFPEGPETTCKSGDVEIQAADAGDLLTEDDFPFESGEEVAKTILDKAGL